MRIGSFLSKNLEKYMGLYSCLMRGNLVFYNHYGGRGRNMQKLLIADASEPFSDALRDIFQHEFELRVCYDGETALEQLFSFQPDVLILNLMLPYKDGLTVLQESSHQPRVILAVSSYVNSYIEQVAVALGVQYIMIMPTVNALRVRLMDMIATTVPHKVDLAGKVAVHLHSLNFLTHLDGYQQLCVGIPIFANNPSVRLTKELYPAIAESFGTLDARTVEHSIRKSIEAAWMRKNPVVWAKYFLPEPDGTIRCPTNKEFISRVAQMLEL